MSYFHDDPPQPNHPNIQRETLRIRPDIADEAFQQSFGTALFRPNKNLVLHFPQVNQTLELSPPPLVFFGRFETDSTNALNIDLTPFEARTRGVSRLHAVLHRTDYSLTLEDTDSYNGTYLNGVRLKPYQPHLIRNGDELMLATLSIHIAFV